MTRARSIPGIAALVVALLLPACTTTSGTPDACPCPPATTDAGDAGPAPDAAPGDASHSDADAGTADRDAGAGDAGNTVVDQDGDGIDDARELALARAYFPYLSLHPDDECTTHGVVFRLAPHPDDNARLHIWFDVLYDVDCGASGHEGDNEAFGVTVDPALPPPAGILAVRTISHQGTPCQQVTDCGPCAPGGECATACKDGAPFPVVFSSVNKHGGYVKEQRCDAVVICDFGGCTLNPTPSEPPMVNAGEPGAPLVTNLTTQGFITAANGWTSPSVMNYDPWGGSDFGSAGNVAEDLVDPAFVVSPLGCNPPTTVPSCNP